MPEPEVGRGSAPEAEVCLPEPEVLIFTVADLNLCAHKPPKKLSAADYWQN